MVGLSPPGQIAGITIVIIYHKMWLEVRVCRDGQKLMAGQYGWGE